MADKDVKITLSAEDNASKVISNAGKSFEGFGEMAKKVGVGITAAGAAITGFATISVMAAIDAEKEMAQATIALANTVDGLGQKELVNLQNELGKGVESMAGLEKVMNEVGNAAVQLGIDDEEASKAFAKLFSVTKNVAQAQKELKLAEDLAAYSGRSLEESAKALTMVHAGGARVLKEFGISVKDVATPMEALAAVQDKVGGSAEQMAKTTAGQFAIMNVEFQNLKEEIGGQLLPVINQALAAIKPFIQQFIDWSKANPELFKNIVLVVGALGALMVVLGPILIALPAIIAGISAFGVVLGIIFSPVGLVIGLLALLGAGIYLLIANWDLVKNKTLEVWGIITSYLLNVWNNILITSQSIWGGIVGFFTAMWETIKTIFEFAGFFILGSIVLIFQAMGINIVEVWGGVVSFFQESWISIQELFAAGLEVLRIGWEFFWYGINLFFMPIWNNIKLLIQTGFTFFQTIFNAAKEPLGAAWKLVWDTLAGIFTTAWNGIKDALSSSINWMIDKLNSIISMINTIAQKGAGIFGMKAPQIPTVSKLASGGIVNSPTLAMIGESGPEAVVPLNKGGMFGGITINISGVFGSDAAEDIGNLIVDRLKLQGAI